ncbi:glycosyl hydrolase family 18 protein [Jiangella alkaliphila]|uniref:chitinase n=1 Tax=Jiangella alkaliphila TaxID=419479 RepID=A0A1H2JAI3_9ACTN|nr:glycosyl hydrolase family 18 protein [Jiangella alkaliphila]SDU53443.1 Chitinase, GH18 family [Jiangella alkaliphila]
MKTRWRTAVAYGAAAGLLVTSVAAAFAGQAPEGAGDPVAASDPAPQVRAAAAAENGYRNVGYFTQWGIYGRDFLVQDLDLSGAASDLTHINYAFANIHPDTLTCFEANRPNGPKDSPAEGDYAGDAWADYGRGFAAGDSVDGVGDTWDQPLAGNFNQIKELKAKYPHLKALVSIGGWTWSRHFSRAAATPESRQRFVSSCIDTFLRGNLPVIDGRGGPGSAAGVFDGFDIDWEWPGVPEELQHPGNHWSPNDKENFTALLAEFRRQLDALGGQTGETYELSAFLPANPVLIDAGWDVTQIFDYLDFGNVQGYDLHGTWRPDLAGHQANTNDDPANPLPDGQRFSVDAAMSYYVDRGVPPAQLTMGIPLYGRGWTGVTDGGTHGAWQPATGAAPGEFPEEPGTDRYRNLRGGQIYHDEDVLASWSYDGTEFWSFDDPWLVDKKADYVTAGGFGGAMWWDLAGDYQNELVGLMGSRLATGGDPGGGDENGDVSGGDVSGGDESGGDVTGGDDGGPGDCTAPAWSASTVYVGGNQVSHNGHHWTARHWTQGDTPAASEWGPWRDDGACSGEGGTTGNASGSDDGTDVGTATGTETGGDNGGPTTACTAPAWNASTVYVGGNQVSHGGHHWTARHWTQGDTPAPSEWGPWRDDGPCSGGTDTGTDTGSDTGTDTGTDTGAEAGSDTGTEDGDPGDPGDPGDRWLTGYWHNFNNGSTVLRVSQVPAAYNLLAIAFADNLAGTPGGITFNLDSGGLGGYTVAQFKADVAARQAAGGTVVISVGGQNGNVSVTNATEAANFAQSTHALMQEYGFDGVDIDLEHGINATYMEQALRQLRNLAGPGLIITMAPQTIDFQAPTFEYYKLALAIRDILTIVNMQYYNSGTMLGCNQQVYAQGTVDFLTALACIQLEAGLAPHQVGLGLPATSQAAGGGYQSPSNVTAALDCLATATRCGSFVPSDPWGPIGGAMTWSVNWDATNGYQFANTLGAYLGTG